MTPKQAELWQWLMQRREDPVCPSYEEMGAAVGLGTKSRVKWLLDALLAQGRITMVPYRSRTVRAVPLNPLADFSLDDLMTEIARRGHRVHWLETLQEEAI